MNDLRAQLIPPEILGLFDDRFVRSCVLIDEYTYRLALQIARSAALVPAPGRAASTEEIAAECGVVPASLPALDWLHRLLAERGALDADTCGRYLAADPWPALDPEEPLAAQRANDPACLPAFALAAAAAAAWSDVLRGASGEEALFTPENAALWSDYFSNANPLYGVTNALAARAAVRWAPAGPLTILEVGGGMGSGALALLEALERGGRGPDLVRYHFTELAPPFLRRGQRALAAAAAERERPLPLETARLDIDRPFAVQGVPPASVDVVFGVNTIHVARDLPATLAEIRAALRPGGVLVMGECVRPFAGRPVYVELAFLLLGSYRARGFLTVEQWLRTLADAGFSDARTYPDLRRLRDPFPLFVAGAVGATRP